MNYTIDINGKLIEGKIQLKAKDAIKIMIVKIGENNDIDGAISNYEGIENFPTTSFQDKIIINDIEA